MLLCNFVEGINITMEHYDQDDGYNGGFRRLGQHKNVFYLHATDSPLSEEEINRMRELGWFQVGDEEREGNYNSTEGWCAFI